MVAGCARRPLGHRRPDGEHLRGAGGFGEASAGDDGLPRGFRADGRGATTVSSACSAVLEVIRTLNDRKLRTRHPVTLAIFTNEEEPASSRRDRQRRHGGKIALEDAYNARDKDGIRLVDELERIGYLGSEPACPAVPGLSRAPHRAGTGSRRRRALGRGGRGIVAIAWSRLTHPRRPGPRRAHADAGSATMLWSRPPR